VISVQFATFISLFVVALEAGGFSFQSVIEVQSWSPHRWNAFRSPFDFLAAFVFYSGGLLLTQMSKPESSFGVRSVDRDLLSRVHGRGYMFFLFGRYFCALYWALFTVILFFGGWKVPLLLQESLLHGEMHGVLQFIEWTVLAGKSLVLLFFTLILWKVNPAPKMDQITQSIWRYLTPLAIVALFGKTALFILRATL
jgi:NADH:ubiquinone oxidoreductase subunit H